MFAQIGLIDFCVLLNSLYKLLPYLNDDSQVLVMFDCMEHLQIGRLRSKSSNNLCNKHNIMQQAIYVCLY